MSINSVCTQVVEGVLLFTGLHQNHASRAAAKQLRPDLYLSLQLTSESETECHIQILANGLGAYYLDGEVFLRTLWDQVPLQQVLSTAGTATEATLKLLCRRIGDPANVMCYSAACTHGHSTDTSQLVVQETVVPRPLIFPAAGGLLVTFTVNIYQENLLYETSKLSAQLHLLHLASPEIHLDLKLEISQDIIYDVQYEREQYRRILHTPFKLITTLQHFMHPGSIPARQSKLYLVRGNTCVIPSFPLSGGSSLSLKLSSSVAVVPHLPLRNGKKIPANRLCNRLHVSVFGPGSLPLLSAASQANFSSANLAEWDSYGLSVGQLVATQYHQPCTADFHPVLRSLIYEVSNGREAGVRRQSVVEVNRSLELFIFLEEADAEGDKRLNDNEHWKHIFGLVHELRRNFDRLVMTHSKKFHQTIHSAMNKLICNYGVHAKTGSVMGTAIPLISEAVASIVLHSCSDRFKSSCMALMEVENEAEIENAVGRQLWRLAKDKQQVSHPSAAEGMPQVPDEPTSPEILQAASEAEKAKETKSRKRMSTNDSPPEQVEDTMQTQMEPGITEQESDVAMTPDVDNTQVNTQTCPSPSLLESGCVLEGDTSWNQSLFQARLATNRRLQCSEARPTEDSTEDYFDTLSRIIEDDLTEVEDDPLTDGGNPVKTASSISPVAQTEEESSVSLLGSQLFKLQPLGSTPTAIQGDFADNYLLDADMCTCASSFEEEASLPLLGPSIERVNSKGVLQPYGNTCTDSTHQTRLDSSTSDSDTECSGFSSTIGVEDTLLESMECNTCKERLQNDHLGDIHTGRHVHTAVSDLVSDTNSCASDSEWNELDYGCSPMTELHRQTLQSPPCDIAVSDPHNPEDDFDCLKEVEFLDDKSSGLNTANVSNPVVRPPHIDCDESLKLDDSLTLQWSDQDFSWDDSEDMTGANKPSMQNHKHHCLASSVSPAGSPKQSTLFTRDCCVPDIADGWEVIEEDFDWD